MTNSSEPDKYNGFKLISLDLKENTLMGKSDLSYSFVESGDNQSEIYTTVLIGANGTGKSNLFRIIIELLKELYDLSKNKERSYNVDGKFKLKFSLNDNIYEYGNIRRRSKEFKFGQSFQVAPTNNEKRPFYLYRNDIKINFDEVLLPKAIVANSIMLTDKYPFFKKHRMENGEKEEAFPQYKYLGVRNTPQSTSTRIYIRKTVEFIVEQLDSSSFRKGLAKATEFLGLSNAIEIYYKTSNTHIFFKGDLTSEKLQEYFNKIKLTYAEIDTSPPFKLQAYARILRQDGLINNICDFANELKHKGRLAITDSNSVKKISYNILDDVSHELLKNDFPKLELLRQLGMISAPEIQLKLKKEEGFPLQESSSGEYHFLSSIVGLMATVKPNSLVFIDEPEISLHPNWQMQYLSFIRELFSDSEYSTSHILIATHSHFLISDLKGESSKIIGLKKEEGKIQIVDLPMNIDTYGWSAEDVLYNVFNVVSTRNKFVAEDIAKILDELSSGNRNMTNKLTKEKYEEIVNLESALKESDPLKSVVKSILKQISS